MVDIKNSFAQFSKHKIKEAIQAKKLKIKEEIFDLSIAKDKEADYRINSLIERKSPGIIGRFFGFKKMTKEEAYNYDRSDFHMAWTIKNDMKDWHDYRLGSIMARAERIRKIETLVKHSISVDNSVFLSVEDSFLLFGDG